MTPQEYQKRMDEAMPHGPNDPCTCSGCHGGKTGCTGYVVGCTCDIDWDAARELQEQIR